MPLSPRAEVRAEVDGLAVGQGLCVEVADEGAGRRAHEAPFRVAVHEAVHVREVAAAAMGHEPWHELLERPLALADDHHVRAVREVVLRVVRRLGAAQHDGGPLRARRLGHAQDAALGHEVAVEPDHGRALPRQ